VLKTGGALCTALSVSASVSPSLYPVEELSVLLLVDDSLLDAFIRFMFEAITGE
jgi:hypothetical protein